MKYSIKNLIRQIVNSKPFTVALVLTMLVLLTCITHPANASDKKSFKGKVTGPFALGNYLVTSVCQTTGYCNTVSPPAQKRL